jgi:chemotaxis signal transduction protein
MYMEVQEKSRQYLTFKLDEEQYGLDVLQVREVLELPRITKVPRMPAYMRGVINIRGSVVPVVDLRLKLGLDEAERTVHTRVVIIEIVTGNDSIAMGIQVDSVQEVVDIATAEIAPAPQIGAQIDAAYINGIAKTDAGFAIIINIGKVFDAQDLGMAPAGVENVGEAAADPA